MCYALVSIVGTKKGLDVSAEKYRTFACERLGLGADHTTATSNDPRKIFHFLGHYKIIDSETLGEAVTNVRLHRVIEYAKYSQPDGATMDVARWRDEREAWEKEYTRHLFMSFADYKIACRASANPPSNPNRHAHLFEEKAVDIFRYHIFKRNIHSPDWKGYRTYLKQASAAFCALLEKKIPAYFSEQDRRTHTYIVGTTGSGKSELLKLIIHGYTRVPDYGSVIVIDPKGDLALQVAQWKENSTTNHLIYIDPFLHPEHTPTINPFDVQSTNEQQKRLIAQELLNALAEILKGGAGANFSLNMRALLMPCILVLLEWPNASIKDLHRFMIQETNADLIAFALMNNNDDIKSFFTNEFDTAGYKTTKQAIATKLRLLLTTRTFADLTCGRSTVDLEQAMNEKKLVVFNLSKGTVGEDESRAFGKLVVALIQAFAQRRTAVDKRYRVPTHLVIDECQNYVTRSIGTILEEARGMKVYMTLAQLSVGSGMSDEIERTVLNMTNVKFIGRSETTEQRKTASVLGIEAGDIANLSLGQFYVRSGTNPVFKFQARHDMLDNTHAMQKKAWENICVRQIKQYYRRKDGSDLPPQQSDSPSNGNAPQTGEISETPLKSKRKLI